MIILQKIKTIKNQNFRDNLIQKLVKNNFNIKISIIN